MTTVVFSVEAEYDLEEIGDYIAADNAAIACSRSLSHSSSAQYFGAGGSGVGSRGSMVIRTPRRTRRARPCRRRVRRARRRWTRATCGS